MVKCKNKLFNIEIDAGLNNNDKISDIRNLSEND